MSAYQAVEEVAKEILAILTSSEGSSNLARLLNNILARKKFDKLNSTLLQSFHQIQTIFLARRQVFQGIHYT